jgi:hypothetical protein
MGTLIFFICLIFGIGIFIYIKSSEKKQWKISGEKELKNKQYEHYLSLRIDEPVSEETINIATNLKEYSNHQKWLKDILGILEEEYKIQNLDIFSDEGISLSEKHEDIDQVFNNSGQYENICKYLQKRPIKELQEDIENKVKIINENTNKDHILIENDENNKELESLKNRVLNLIYEKKERAEIIKVIKKENKDKKNFKIWCENKVWNINYFVENEIQQIKFRKSN